MRRLAGVLPANGYGAAYDEGALKRAQAADSCSTPLSHSRFTESVCSQSTEGGRDSKQLARIPRAVARTVKESDRHCSEICAVPRARSVARSATTHTRKAAGVILRAWRTLHLPWRSVQKRGGWFKDVNAGWMARNGRSTYRGAASTGVTPDSILVAPI